MHPLHPRLTPANGHVALAALKGRVTADRFVDGLPRSVSRPVADLLRRPGAGLDCQLLFGAAFLVLEEQAGFAFGQAVKDGYCGYVRLTDIGAPVTPSHRISALASHVYSAADIKSPAITSLPFGAKVEVGDMAKGFAVLTSGGYVPAQHLAPLSQAEPDFVAVFQRFTGIPYLWGGNSTRGMDCSGAVQLSLDAAGRDCPRDSDMQLGLGTELPAGQPKKRGDLVFWKGHVGAMLDATDLIHANAHHMAVATEPLAIAERRIAENGGGPVLAVRRL